MSLLCLIHIKMLVSYPCLFRMCACLHVCMCVCRHVRIGFLIYSSSRQHASKPIFSIPIWCVTVWVRKYEFDKKQKGLDFSVRKTEPICFSGWRETVDACFSSHAKSTLSNMVTKLEEHRKWKFIWAETAFLSRWYDGASDTEKQSLKRYIYSFIHMEKTAEIFCSLWLIYIINWFLLQHCMAKKLRLRRIKDILLLIFWIS